MTAGMDAAAVAAALEEVRALVAADGGDMVLDAVEGSEVRLKLVLGDAACVECVMPRDFLEQIALDSLRREVPSVASVVIDDPREHPDFVPPAH